MQKLCENNSVKHSAKNVREERKKVKKRKKKIWQHSKNVRKIVKKKQCWDRRQNHSWARKNFTEFLFFSGQAVCSPLLKGVGHKPWDSFPWHCRHGRVRVYPPLTASMFLGWGTSMHTCSWSLDSFGKFLLRLVLALYWSNRGVVAENPWRRTLFGVSQISVKHLFVLHAVLLQNPPRQDFVHHHRWRDRIAMDTF